MNSYWSEFLLVAGAHLLAVASPGPDFAIVLRQSVTHGRRAAIWTSLGIGTGILIHVGYSLLGLGVLVSQSPLWFNIVKWTGAAYLAWIGVNALRTRPAVVVDGETALRSAEAPANHSAFVTGFLVNILNPKAALFFIALFVTVIDPATPRGIQAAYGLWMAGATAAWFACVSLFFTRETVRRAFLRSGHWFDRGMGVLLLALAARLALASAH
ncbi:MAG: lysine transporter LysE [Opitutus sp.]|nr:lysine transporter LysE [Opitutus sp.]